MEQRHKNIFPFLWIMSVWPISFQGKKVFSTALLPYNPYFAASLTSSFGDGRVPLVTGSILRAGGRCTAGCHRRYLSPRGYTSLLPGIPVLSSHIAVHVPTPATPWGPLSVDRPRMTSPVFQVFRKFREMVPFFSNPKRRRH